MLRHHSVRGVRRFAAALLVLFACSDPRNDPKPEPRTTGHRTGPTASATSSSTTSAQTSATPKPPSVGDKAAGSLDLGKVKLNDREKGTLAGVLESFQSPCASQPVNLAQCVVDKRDCKTCKPAAELLGRLVRQGKQPSELEEIFKLRFDDTFVKKVELGSAPTRGPADAPVTIVEWADFQCPHCNQFRFIIELMEERFPEQVKLAYKFYKLDIPGHENALEAAYAAYAAKNQGKFWEMHKKLFDNQEGGLDRAAIRKFARELDLDIDKFKKDMESEETKQAVAADIKQANDLGLNGTPFIWVNGRLLPFDKLGGNFLQEFEQWVKLDIELAGQTPASPTQKYQQMMDEIKAASGGGDTPPEPGASGSASAGPPPDGSASAAPSASAPVSAAPSASASASAKAPAASASVAASASAKPKKAP